jgi:hypothetical protein
MGQSSEAMKSGAEKIQLPSTRREEKQRKADKEDDLDSESLNP